MATYTSVQFIGYAIPSIPLTVEDIGDPGTPCFVEGRYEGIEPETADIDARIALTMSAVRQTLKSGAVDRSASTLKIFVVPEFSFRGARGAYDAGEFTYFRERFAKRVSTAAFKDWLFVAGTIVNTVGGYRRGRNRKRDLKARVRENLAIALADAWQYSSAHDDQKLASFINTTLDQYTAYCHDDPVYEVANRSFVVAGGPPDPDYPEGLSIQKKFESNEDFVLNFHGNALAEDSTGYPPIHENKGENKRRAFDDYSIFTIKGIKFGVEVCLDHLQARLRRNRIPQNELVQIHLVPSSGMQIQEPSIVACGSGLVFNCDGQYDTLAPDSQPGAADSIWTGTASHRAHTQLTEVVQPCRGRNPASNTAVLRRPAAKVTKVPVADSAAAKLYAYGPGEVHVYTPLPVPPAG
ncbi:MAG TPA: hypothetical protein VF432_25840 [Thermoanaerobaculia bacterium]